MNTRFPKSERVHLEDTIQALLKTSAVAIYPLRFAWLKKEDQGTELLVLVSKKKLPHAVDRNTMKRRIRATFRTYKHHFLGYSLMVSYLPKEILPSDQLSVAWEAFLNRLTS